MGSLIRILLILQISLLATSQAAHARGWQVQLADGSDMKLSVASNSGVIEFRNGQAVVFTIPADSISEILHTTLRMRRSTKTYNSFERVCCGGTGSHLLSALAAAVAAPMGSAKSHYVEIHWNENADHVVALELGKDEYLPFMDWLQQLSGTQWRDVAREREQAVKSIEHRAGGAFHVTIGHTRGFIGSYSVLPLDDNDNTQLYFFDGGVNLKNVVGILPATRVWSMNTCVLDAEVLYGKCHERDCDIEAIMLPTLTYRVTTLEATNISKPAGESDGSCLQLKEQKEEWARRDRDEDRNQPTLRRAAHPHTPPPF